MNKATAIAPSNIAFIKYWGKKDDKLRLPENGSISMCLSNLQTTTTVEFDKKFGSDEVSYNGKKVNDKRVADHLDRIREIGKTNLKAKVVTENNFPAKTGLSSSASGFAALTVAAAKAAGLVLTEKELSILARQGSGSACRSIPDGFVQWLDGDSSSTSYSKTIFSKGHWELCDLVAIISTEKKYVSTTDGQKLTGTSPFYKTRLRNITDKINLCKELIKEKNFEKFGELIESEALELHSIMLTSKPSLIYLLPESLMLMKEVLGWRKEGLGVYFTLNTGQNVHLIVEKKNALKLKKLVDKLSYVKQTIVNSPSDGSKLTNKHLF